MLFHTLLLILSDFCRKLSFAFDAPRSGWWIKLNSYKCVVCVGVCIVQEIENVCVCRMCEWVCVCGERGGCACMHRKCGVKMESYLQHQLSTNYLYPELLTQLTLRWHIHIHKIGFYHRRQTWKACDSVWLWKKNLNTGLTPVLKWKLSTSVPLCGFLLCLFLCLSLRRTTHFCLSLSLFLPLFLPVLVFLFFHLLGLMSADLRTLNHDQGS